MIRWYRALNVVEVAGWTAGSSHGVILCSVAKVLAAQAATAQDEKTKLNLAEEAKISFENAKKSLATEERKYCIVGLGSYWYDYVVTPTLDQSGKDTVVSVSTTSEDSR